MKKIALFLIVLSTMISCGSVKSTSKNTEWRKQSKAKKTANLIPPKLIWIRVDDCRIEAIAPEWANSYSLSGTLNRVIKEDRKVKAGQSCICGWGDEFIIFYGGSERAESYVIPRIPCL